MIEHGVRYASCIEDPYPSNRQVLACRHYRKTVLVEMPALRNLDDMPCFPRDRRLAAAFMAGGAAAERAERDVIRSEEAAERERHRRAFDDLVAQAKADAIANPLPPADPMRFRAVPPGLFPT
jgi:hypothetical protein